MAQTTIRTTNSGKPAPKWFRKFKKIFSNTENAVLVLLALKFPAESPVFLYIKVGSNLVLENMETLLANGEKYVPDTTEQNQTT